MCDLTISTNAADVRTSFATLMSHSLTHSFSLHISSLILLLSDILILSPLFFSIPLFLFLPPFSLFPRLSLRPPSLSLSLPISLSHSHSISLSLYLSIYLSLSLTCWSRFWVWGQSCPPLSIKLFNLLSPSSRRWSKTSLRTKPSFYRLR